MGASLSTQEDLFVSQKWDELLQEAMSADVEAVAASTGPGGRTHGSRPNRSGGPETFFMSSREWQAFLGLLEAGSKAHEKNRVPSAYALKQAGSAPSAICDQLTPEQLHCPLVPLAVHAFALWAGSIDQATFLARLERLEELVFADDERGDVTALLDASSEDDAAHPAAHTAPKRQGRGPAGTRGSGADSEDEEDYFGESEEDEEAAFGAEGTDDLPDAPMPSPPEPHKGKRRRLFEALKNRVTSKKPASATGNPTSEQPTKTRRVLFLVDEYLALESLYHNLIHELIHTHSDSSVVAAHPTPFHPAESPRMRTDYREINAADTMQHRPVARVALCIGLALYSALVPPPLYAVDGILRLRELDKAMRDGSVADEGHAEETRGSSSTGPPVRESVTRQWPWVAALEDALVHKQHALDVQQCLGEDGQQLTTDLRALRDNRQRAEAENSTGSSAGATERFARMTPAQRWAYCESQYIGQRHIWGPLTSHFLSADIFDADKPTVLVFFGPSGFGKSELAKQVASAVHGCPVKDLEASGKMIYIHMPSFATKESVYSLVDPPAAHVGDGILLSALHQHPDAVVVLDEFEKSTAEAVQNIWLSAFQKNGVLRSLKRADRSISTVKTTFILTCNIAADTIEKDANRYLASSPSQQAQMRQRYVEACKDVCRVGLGDPFVNRVDSFYAFTPYSRLERQDYVELTLERLLAAQERKGRHLHVTPRCVAALVSRLRTFHASTIEEILRPLLVDMSLHKWSEAVLTIESRAVEQDSGGYTSYVLLPCDNTAGQPVTDIPAGTDVWTELPDGARCWRMWHQEDETHGAAVGCTSSPLPCTTSTTTGSRQTIPDETAHRADQSAKASSPTVAGAAPVTGETELDLERTPLDTEKLTERELTLTKELHLARELLLRKDKEIATLKEKVLMLEKLLGVMMCVVMCCSMAMYLIVGWKLTFVLLGLMLAGVTLVLNIPLWVLLDALRAFFRFLGPAKSAIVVLLMSAWVLQASKGLRCG